MSDVKYRHKESKLGNDGAITIIHSPTEPILTAWTHQLVVETALTVGTLQVAIKPLGASTFFDITPTVNFATPATKLMSFQGEAAAIRLTPAGFTGAYSVLLSGRD